MAITRKQINNLIIIFCLLFISSMYYINQYINPPSAPTQALFDASTPLQQLQLQQDWLSIDKHVVNCSANVSNCQAWVQAWQSLTISPLTTEPEIVSEPMELLIQAGNLSEMQLWLYFPEQRLLKSPSSNWFIIPPSQNPALIPSANTHS